jgi:hypothetical protein
MPTPDHQLNQAALDQAIALAQANETSWTRDPQREPLRFGVHHDDPPPWNQLRGPVHARGPVSGVVWQQGREIAAWGEPARSDQTFSVAKTCLALLAGGARGLLPNVDYAVAAQLPGIGSTPHNDHTGSCWSRPVNGKAAASARPTSGPLAQGVTRPVPRRPQGGLPLQAWQLLGAGVRINQLAARCICSASRCRT